MDIDVKLKDDIHTLCFEDFLQVALLTKLIHAVLWMMQL